MNSPHSPAALGSADLEVVLETLEEIRGMPPPRDNQPTGCLMSLGGIVVLLGMPVLARFVEIGSGAGSWGLIVGGALTVIGVVTWMTAGGFVRGNYIAAAEAALRELEGWTAEDGDREVALRAATLLLTHSVAVYGPTSTSSFEPHEAEKRLGAMMPLVLAVQQVLVEEEACYPVFE